MAKQNRDNATCIICGKGYHLCIACERTKGNWKQWKMITDTENCYDIYHVLNDYNFGKITKDEARILLEKLDLKEVDSFRESVKKMIKEIMKKERTVKPVKVAAEIVEEVIDIEVEVENN